MFHRALFAAFLVTFAFLQVQSAPAQAQRQQNPAQSARDVELVRFSYAASWDALPAIVALERGFFAAQDLVVSGMPTSSAEAVLKSVAVGSTDVASVPQRTFLVMAAADFPVRVISLSGWGRPVQLIAPDGDATTKSLADLKGKRIAMVQGSEAYPVLIRLLNAARLRTSDVTPVFLTADALTRAFDSGAAEAIFETRHYTDALVAVKKARVVLPSEKVVEQLGLINAAPLVANVEFLSRRPEVAQRFVNAWIRAQRYIQQDPQDAAKLLQVFFHRQGVLVSEELALSWTKLTHYDKYLWSEIEVADAEYNGWGLKEGGIFEVQPKIAGYVDNAFAQRAAAQLR